MSVSIKCLAAADSTDGGFCIGALLLLSNSVCNFRRRYCDTLSVCFKQDKPSHECAYSQLFLCGQCIEDGFVLLTDPYGDKS